MIYLTRWSKSTLRSTPIEVQRPNRGDSAVTQRGKKLKCWKLVACCIGGPSSMLPSLTKFHQFVAEYWGPNQSGYWRFHVFKSISGKWKAQTDWEVVTHGLGGPVEQKYIEIGSDQGPTTESTLFLKLSFFSWNFLFPKSFCIRLRGA